MGQLFTNNATAILQGNISAVDTQLTVTASLADLFKVATTSNWGAPLDWYKVTLEDNLGNTEIVKVGIRTLGSGILSNLLRGQDGTTARNWNAGANVSARFTADDLNLAVGAAAALNAKLAGTGVGQGGLIVGHAFPEAPAFAKTLSDIANNEEVSINRFLSQAKINDIAENGNSFDVAADLNTALAASQRINMPRGTYTIGSRVAQQTNAGRRSIRGEAKFATIIKTSTGVTNLDGALWLGNNTGHGVYQSTLENLVFDGGGKANNNLMYVCHEGGLSAHHNLVFQNCGQAAILAGAIFTEWSGRNYIVSSRKGVEYTRPVAGTPSGPFDRSTTNGPLSLVPNVSNFGNTWFSAIDEEVLILAGGLMDIRQVVVQSCGSGGTRDLISIVNANESFDYGGGPGLENIWVEGGSYRYAIAVRNTRAAALNRIFISGSSSDVLSNFPKEGGILLDNADNTSWTNTSIRGFFNAAATEGRIGGGTPALGPSIYVSPTTRLHTCTHDTSNYFAPTQCAPYYEGIVLPTTDKTAPTHWAVVSISASVATVINESAKVIASFTRNGPGDWTLTYAYNRETGTVPITVTPMTSSAIETFSVSEFATFNAGNDRIIFKNGAGVLTDPAGFHILWYGRHAGV